MKPWIYTPMPSKFIKKTPQKQKHLNLFYLRLIDLILFWYYVYNYYLWGCAPPFNILGNLTPSMTYLTMVTVLHTVDGNKPASSFEEQTVITE